MAKKKQTTPGRGPLHQGQQRVAVNLDAPTAAKQQQRRKITRWAIWSNSFVLVPLVGVVGLLYLAENFNKVDEASVVSSRTINSSGGKASANIAMKQWLKSVPAPLPKGEIVAWDGYDERVAPPLPDDAPEGVKRPTYTQELHHFTLTDGVRFYDSDVLVHVDEVLGAKVVSSPTLLPRAAYVTGGWSGEMPWFGFQQNTTNHDITPAVQEWVEAFVSGSPKKLKQAVSDPAADHSYVPLSNVESAAFSVPATATKEPKTKEDPPPTWLIARVELEVTWKDQDELEPGERLSKVAYDLLVTGIDSATPKVVSWGGPGSGPDLRKYSVALKGLELDEPGEHDTDRPDGLGTNLEQVGKGDGEAPDGEESGGEVTVKPDPKTSEQKAKGKDKASPEDVKKAAPKEDKASDKKPAAPKTEKTKGD
ncbi:hypothetical protein ACXR2T_07730 [Leucobacter sp. HY1910]